MEGSKSNIHLAVVAGILATTGSLFGKVAGNFDVMPLDHLVPKICFLGLMIGSNTAGCTYFVKALQGSGSSLPATVASAATNYFCSALIGFLAFGESTSLMWWSGTSLILFGLLLICYAPVKESPVTTKRKEQ
ncbi:transmembrane protein 42 isoform X2 [Belonocnema kinseyi]|uniref:transmembrane protein 42 isoform X2 n=1 Tax=Belonocnema kinseyi TaxID=2817044 RepID=UPI00143CD77B|nr:transmembrane protein 42 isoform X2 [Belonocnema kinseyi]XP_033215171.1 transmembrane protein 42 isoform X2 [Belonocnema kinseyi]XP_033215172.1 transmembrane protein 42 isoform X2 [Belonocnema kinseyi]